MGLTPPELTEGMKAALALTGVGLLDPLPVEEAAQCAAVFAIAVARFCDPVRCEFDDLYTETFPVALPPSWPRATKATSRNVLKGSVPQHVIDALDAAMQNQAWLNSYGMAMLKTVFRRYSAKIRTDAASEQRQKEYQERLCKEISSRSRDVAASWKRLLSDIKKTKVKVGVVTPARIVQLQKRIWKDGFPVSEARLLREWHLGERDIHWLQILAACTPPPRKPVPFTAMIESLIKLNEKYEFCECRCKE
jgi:hypothetical protein